MRGAADPASARTQLSRPQYGPQGLA